MSISWILILILSWICSGANSLLNLNRPPVFTIEPNSTIIAVKGRSVTLNCNVDGNPPPRVDWTRNGKPVPSPADTRRLILPSGSLHITKIINYRGNKPDVGVYQCIATNKVGTTVSRKVKLSVAVLSKKFREHPQNETVVEGTTARFSCKIRKAIPDPTVTWEKNGTPIDSGNKRFVTLPQGILQISDVKVSDMGRYGCVVKSMAKTRHSNYASLTVKRVGSGRVVGLNFTVPPSNITSVIGGTAVMECVTTGKPRPVVTWKKLGNRQKLQDVSQGINNLQIKGVTEEDSGQYECVATADGKTIQSSAWLTVKEPPHFTSRPIGEVFGQEGLPVRLLCSAKGSPFPKITWFKNGRELHSNSRVRISVFRGNKELQIRRTVVDDSGVYQCFAENDMGNIQVSSRIRVRRSVLQPAAPTNLVVTATSQSSLHLTWQEPVFGPTIRHYSIHCTPSGEQIALEKIAPDTSTFYNFDGLNANTEYACFVRGYSRKAIGDASKVVKVKTLAKAPREAPQNVVVISKTPDSLDVLWNPPYKSEQNGVIINYLIRYIKTGKSAVRTVNVPGNDRVVTINELSKGKTYAVQVAAQTNGGTGPYSQMKYGTVLVTPNEVISAPHFAPPVLNASAARVAWSPPLYGAQNVTEYRLYYKKTSGNAQQVSVTINKQKREYLLNKLEPEAKYTLKLQAWDRKQAGQTATLVVRTTPANAPPSAPPLPPQNVRCKASGASLQVSWDESRKDIASYTVKYEIKGNKDKSMTKTQDTLLRHALLVGLTPDKEYTVTVQSHRSVKTVTPGQFSKAANGCLTHNAKPFSPPTDVKFQYLTTTSVELSWKPPTQPNGKLIEYKVLYSVNKTQDDIDWKSMSVPSATEIFPSRKIETTRINGLEPNVTYYVKIFAGNNMGYGPPSEPITIKNAVVGIVPVVLRPPAPTNLAVTATSPTSIRLTWKEPVSSFAILHYSIHCTPSGGSKLLEQVSPDTSTFYNFGGLSANTEYACYVKGYSLKRIGDASQVVKVRTLAKDSGVVPTRSTTSTITTKANSPSASGIVEPKVQKEFAIKLGIIIGCVITAFFIVILALFITWRNPCRYAYPHQPKQVLELTTCKLPGNGVEPSTTQQIAFPHEFGSQKGSGKEESSLSSGGVGNCHCHHLQLISSRPPHHSAKLRPKKPEEPKQAQSDKILPKSALQNLASGIESAKAFGHCNGNSKVQTTSGKVFTMNGSVHPGSASSFNINTNGSISSELNGGVNKMLPFKVQNDGSQPSVVVIERRLNSNSISVDV